MEETFVVTRCSLHTLLHTAHKHMPPVSASRLNQAKAILPLRSLWVLYRVSTPTSRRLSALTREFSNLAVCATKRRHMPTRATRSTLHQIGRWRARRVALFKQTKVRYSICVFMQFGGSASRCHASRAVSKCLKRRHLSMHSTPSKLHQTARRVWVNQPWG